MKPNQPQLPSMPRDFSKPITARGSELAAVIKEAQAAGWTAHRMRVLPEVIYELQFFRLAGTAEAGRLPEKSKESFLRPIRSKVFTIPASPYEPKLLTASVSHAKRP
jgi:hypothetical protein